MKGHRKKWLVSDKEVVLTLRDVSLQYVMEDHPLLSQGDLCTDHTCTEHVSTLNISSMCT